MLKLLQPLCKSMDHSDKTLGFATKEGESYLRAKACEITRKLLQSCA